MAGCFELHVSQDGLSEFSLKSSSGDTILVGGTSSSESDAKRQIEWIRSSCAFDRCYEVKTSALGRLYFYLVTSDGHVAATSRLHSTLDELRKDIDAVKETASSASINVLREA